ncbi:GntR family transcriptional regulator [Ottowia sp.]|uniref:GntR family transcriptional regulator n=1 Tax=Ottowia sp. TaxID=1898956 RepID=UPI0039E2440A
MSDLVYRRLRDSLVTLEYLPKTPLNERNLSAELNVGLAPIREALRRLERERLVVIYPRQGIFAAEIAITDQQLIKEIRLEIEGLAAELAALRASDDERQALVKLADAVVLVTNSGEKINGDAKVHRAIYQMARNSFLEPILAMHFNLSLRLWHFCRRMVRRPDMGPIDHRPLARAIAAGDAALARRLLSEHVAHDSDALRDILRAC